jgi:hypothetical protein
MVMRLAFVALVSMFLLPPQSAPKPPAGFPAAVERYLGNARLTAEDRKQLLAGMPVARALPADASKELAVFGALWVRGSIDRYVQRLTDIEQFERGGRFKLTRKISSPPALSDFASMRLSDEDVRDLRYCEVGNCDVKLSEHALTRLKSEIDWKPANSRAAVDAFMRQFAFDFVTAYAKGGDQALPVYRDRGRPISSAVEFRDMVNGMPELALYGPDLRRYLFDFPSATLPNATSFLYWQDTEFGLKPIIRISHLTIRQGPTETTVASRMLYATHYFWTALDLRALVPDPARGQGFWLLTTSRSRTDGLSGLTGLFIRRRVRSEVIDGTIKVLQSTQEKMDQPEKPR